MTIYLPHPTVIRHKNKTDDKEKDDNKEKNENKEKDSDKEKHNDKRTNLQETIYEEFSTFYDEIKSVDFPKNKKILLLNFSYLVGLTSFFMKFSVLLKARFGGTAIMVGYTIAYHNVSMILIGFLAGPFRNFLNPLRKDRRISIGLFVLTCGAFGVCFSPNLLFYFISFFLLAVGQNLLKTLLLEKYEDCGIASPSSCQKVVDRIASVCTPLPLGLGLDLFGSYTVQFFVFFPIVQAVVLAHKNENLKVIRTD